MKFSNFAISECVNSDVCNTLEYIGIWEKVYNPDFNYGEFAIIRNQSGLNSFKISVKKSIARTIALLH